MTHKIKNEYTRPKSRTSKSYENALRTDGISWISASSTKPLESGKQDFELVWLQKKYSLNIGLRREHLLLTLCHVLFLTGRRAYDSCRANVCWFIKMHVIASA